jgi:hypothetical protein
MRSEARTMRRLLPALLLVLAAGSAHAAGRCTAVVDAVNIYRSAEFDIATPEDFDPLFPELPYEAPQARDFEAYVRAHYPARGEVVTTCQIAVPDDDLREGARTIAGVTFQYVNTGYVPKAR